MKYVTVMTCNAISWKRYAKSTALKEKVAMYHQVLETMEKNFEDMTLENLDRHLGLSYDVKEKKEHEKKKASSNGFIDFMEECISKEKLAHATAVRKRVTIDAVLRFGKMNRFSDVTPMHVKEFDDFLRGECERTTVTIHNYHKIVKMYTRLACQMGYINEDPYSNPLCKFERGKYKERRPLTEDELVRLRSLNLPEKEARIRDLFVFCAYTGLAYIDSQLFDYETMTETLNGHVYIDGKRVKTDNTYFTPILPPAMEVLEKYDYKLPHISNQKANDFLHLIESRMCINKPLTMHVARHSFATLALSYDIPIENVARMMGHTRIQTTQIYAKVLKSTIERHVENLASCIR